MSVAVRVEIVQKSEKMKQILLDSAINTATTQWNRKISVRSIKLNQNKTVREIVVYLQFRSTPARATASDRERERHKGTKRIKEQNERKQTEGEREKEKPTLILT